MQDLVYKLGFVERRWIPPLLAGADFLVYPSLFEGFGLPVLEAMALGTPVACAEKTSLPEVGGDAVLFFDEKKVPSIREAIRNLWNNPLKRTEFAKRGRKRAQLFHKKIGIKTLLDIYDRMVGMRGFKKGIQ